MSRGGGSWRPRDDRKDRGTAAPAPDVTLQGVTLGRETEKAVLVTVKDRPTPIWLPLSQVKKMTRAGPGIPGKDTIIITPWIAKEKGLA